MPAVGIAALPDSSREQHRHDHASKEMRAAYLKYAEIALREARGRVRSTA
jgi:hypothetical protein